ncbi:hypothetical protein F5Y07DRAFT_393521 [Xylaria sp. FL0933]|nr:hypothetical protein F5Y07DRAFT_393521 [Xylaria sp. FL0933]
MDTAKSIEDTRSLSPTIEPPQFARGKKLRETSLELTNEANIICKRLKRSYDNSSDYWSDIATVHNLRGDSKRHALEWEKEEFVNDGGSIEVFLGLEKTTQIEEAIKAHERLRDLYRQHQARLDNSSVSSRIKMSLFTTSRRGLDINAGMGSRSRKDQRSFHKALLNYYDLEDRENKNRQGLLWSVAQGDWVHRRTLKAAHIYPYSWGQARMTDLFGEECSEELFSPRNGLMLPGEVEEAMEDWAIVIVPAINDDPTVEQSKEWADSCPREYKFRILDPDHPALNQKLFTSQGPCGKDLDQVKLKFRGKSRPRARYLWMWFACAVLRQFWKDDPQNAASNLAPQLGKGMWGTKGPYLRKDFILGLMEEIGHKGEFLMDGAKPAYSTEDNVPNKALVDLVNQDIASKERDELDYLEYLENIEHGSEADEE